MSMEKQVLIVDDDPNLRQLLTIALELTGFGVDQAGDGEQAISKILKMGRVDLIVLDMMMPVMDGTNFLSWLRGERRSDIPVLALTAVEMPGCRTQLMAAGANDVVFKPFKARQLMARIQTLAA